MSVPDLEELYSFKKCVRKYARVKLRATHYYNDYLVDKNKDSIERNL